MSTAASLSTPPESILSQLKKPFPVSLVKKDENQMHHISIEAYLDRLDDVVGAKWQIAISRTETHDAAPTAKGKPQYLNRIEVALTIEADGYKITRVGVGAAKSFDPDTAYKAAYAQATKKACHQFGMARELWNPRKADLYQ